MSLFSFLRKLNLRSILFAGFIFFYIVNITQLFVVHQNSVKLDRMIQEEFARIDSKYIQQQLDSDENKEYFLKSRLYKKTDEIVIDTSSVEDKDKKPFKNQYYQFYNKVNKKNWEIWYDCYFGEFKRENKCF
jgi:hypothetical protein